MPYMTSVTSTPLAFCACCMCVQFLFSLYNIRLSTNILHAHAYCYFMYSISILTGIVPRVHNNKSVQLPYGFYTRHLDGMTQTISSEYANQLLNMKPFEVLVYISHVNTVAKACLFTAEFLQLSIFTADCLHHPIQSRYRNHMGVAYSYCYELLIVPNACPL